MTSSAISLSQVVTCAVIASTALILLLFFNELYGSTWKAHTATTKRLQLISAFIPEWLNSLNANRVVTLGVISLPLVVTFCAFVVFKVAIAL
jgi:hypothetical protein